MIILADRGDEQKVIKEEREEWVNKVLISLGITQEIFQEREQCRNYMLSLDIEMWENEKKEITIYHRDKLVAEWKQPKLVLIKEPKSMYYEIHLKCWARPLQKIDK